MAFLYPWGNTQQLNLDWVLQKIKELEAGSGGGGGAGADLEEVANALISATYAVQAYDRSDIVFYDGKLYRANQAIPAPGEIWTPAHWDEILLGDTVSNLVQYVAALRNDQIVNRSSVSGDHTSDALDTLKNAIDAITLDSDSVSNKSQVTGDNVTDALDNLNGAITDLQTATNGKKVKIVCGAIRNSGTGWEVINDSGHNPINITGVSIQTVGGNPVLQIAHDCGASKVLAMIVGCDETFAGLYDIGASVGINLSNLTIYRKAHAFGGMIIVNNQTPDLQYSDFTLRAFYPDGGIDINYPESLNIQEVFRVATSGMNCICEPYSLGTDHCILRARNVATGDYYTQANIPDNTRLIATFNVEEKIIDPTNIVNANGNFWIFGLLEIA